jgi:hypothetical protein
MRERGKINRKMLSARKKENRNEDKETITERGGKKEL